MKILLIHNRYVLTGGEDQVFDSEKLMLENQGHEVIVYERSNLEINKYSFVQKLYFFVHDVFWSRRTFKDVSHLIQIHNPDIVHCHNIFYVISSSVYDACFRTNVPVVQTIHNYRLLCLNAVFYRENSACQKCVEKTRWQGVKYKCWKNSYFKSMILLFVIERIHQKILKSKKIKQLIVLSQFSREQFERSHIDVENMVVKPNSLEFDPGFQKAKKDFVLCVGAFQPYKGVETLIKAWQDIHDQELILLGDGPLMKKTQAMNLNPRVTFVGQKPMSDVLDYIKSAAFIVMPSECFENCPRVLIEAFACGTPVLATRFGAMKEIVDDGRTGLLFEVGNVEDLKKKIGQLLHDQRLRDRLAQEGRKEFEVKYTKQKNYEALLKIYQDCLGK